MTNSSSVAWYYNSLRSTSETVGFLFLYGLLDIVIMTGNTLVIAAYKYSAKVRQQDTSLFFVSLAVSDLLVGAVSLPLWMYYVYCSHTGAHCHKHDSIKYVYRNFDVLSAFASIAHLTIISIERKVVTSRLRSQPVERSSKTKYCVPLCAWLYAVSVSTTYAICYKQNFKTQRTLLVFLGGFIIPVLVIASMYLAIYRRLNFIDTRLGERHDTEGALVSRPESRREKKVAATVAILIILFILCWLPFFVVSMMFTFCQLCLPRGNDLIRLMDFVKFMHYSNSAINPCVYSYRNKKIKEEILRFIAGLSAQDQSPSIRRRNELQPPAPVLKDKV